MYSIKKNCISTHFKYGLLAVKLYFVLAMLFLSLSCKRDEPKKLFDSLPVEPKKLFVSLPVTPKLIGQRVTLCGKIRAEINGYSILLKGQQRVYLPSLENYNQYVGKIIEITGILAEDYNLSVYTDRRGGWPLAGTPVPPGIDIRKASHRFILKDYIIEDAIDDCWGDQYNLNNGKNHINYDLEQTVILCNTVRVRRESQIKIQFIFLEALNFDVISHLKARANRSVISSEDMESFFKFTVQLNKDHQPGTGDFKECYVRKLPSFNARDKVWYIGEDPVCSTGRKKSVFINNENLPNLSYSTGEHDSFFCRVKVDEDQQDLQGVFYDFLGKQFKTIAFDCKHEVGSWTVIYSEEIDHNYMNSEWQGIMKNLKNDLRKSNLLPEKQNSSNK